MRVIDQEIINRNNDVSAEFYVRAVVEPSSIFLSADDFDMDHQYDAPDSNTWTDDIPVIQQVTNIDNVLVTFYRDGTNIRYQRSESSTILTVPDIMAYGVIGVWNQFIYFVDENSELVRYEINPDVIAEEGAGVLFNKTTVASDMALCHACHATGDGSVVALMWDDGGFRARYYVDDGGWQVYEQPYRFMFPRGRKFTDVDVESLALTMRVYTASAILNEDVYCYVSNFATGSIDGVKWDHDTKTWGDVFTAVPANIDTAMCSIRISNAYVMATTIYLCTSFKRIDEELSPNIYTMIMKSDTGKQFSMDRFSVVSNVGYRLLAKIMNSNLVLSGCNRVAAARQVYTFDGDEGYGDSETILTRQIGTFNDNSNMSAQLQLAAGNEYLLYNNKLRHGSRVKVYTGATTPNGYRDCLYGTYIINRLPKGIANGQRSLSVDLQNEADWRLSSMSSPFYTEMASKSSLFDNMIQSQFAYTAGSCGGYNNGISIDFWGAEGYDDEARGWKGLSLDYKGGVDSKGHASTDKVAIRTPDLEELLYLEQYPTIIDDTIHADIYGWSSPTSGSVGDLITLILWIKDAETEATSIVTQEAGRWPCTYPITGPGDSPISIDVTGLTVGDSLVYVGLLFENDVDATYICPHRVDFMSGLSVAFGSDENSPWKDYTSGSGVEVPGYDRPYIMFYRKPYDTFNFSISARFEDTISGEISGYPVAWGLVGLALDGSNYICARYDKTAGVLEILQVVDREETVLASAIPTTTIATDNEIMFKHRDGSFKVYLKDGSEWVENLSYDWEYGNGWMFKDPIAARHCGIYGLIKSPNFRIIGFDPGSDEETTNAEAIPFFGLDPSVLDDFPTSGSVSIDECIYEYSSIFKPAIIRGPSQFRQSGDGTSGHYTPPYGTGKPGLECHDFDWNKSNGEYAGYVIAIDDGASYMCTDTDWQVYNTTGGVVKWLRERGRYYADGSQLGKAYHDCSNKVYLTGGLLEPKLIKGESSYHPTNTICRILTQGHIVCKEFTGHSGDTDATVEDLVQNLASFSSAKVTFPGDIGWADLYIDPSAVLATQRYMSGCDVRLRLPELTIDEPLQIGVEATYSISGDTEMRVSINKEDSNIYSIELIGYPSMVSLGKHTFSTGSNNHITRVLFHDNFVTVYFDDMWICSYALAGTITYADEMDIVAYVQGSGITIVDVKIADLADWREAVYFDLDTTSKSGIESVIQERPVEITAKSDGSLCIAYDPDRNHITVNPDNIAEHQWVEQIPPDGSSDGIIYFATDVKTIQNTDYLEDFGFSTKIYRYPNLTSGAIRAAILQQKRFYEQREEHSLRMRPDFRIEVGDVLEINYLATGTGRAVGLNLTVESISLDIRQVQRGSAPSMQISGRFHDG
jgi:hypothetical protein